MTFKFQINGSPFWVSQSIEGYRWMPANGYGRLCPTLLAAQQDAIDTVQKHIDDEKFALIQDSGDYHDQRRES